MSMPPGWPAILASDRLSFCLLLVLSAPRRSRTPDRPAESSSPDGSLVRVHRAVRWPLWKFVGGAGLCTRHLGSIFVQRWVVFHYQEGVVILLQDSHELEHGEGPQKIQLGDIAVQSAEDARVVAAYKEDLVPLQIEVVIDGI